MSQKADTSHPLYGANLATLWSVWRKADGLSPDRRQHMRGAFSAALGRLPFSLVERAYVAVKRHQAKKAPAPIFILGHWRSGTTHLYNVLSKSDRFGYVSPFATALPWDFLLLGRALAPLLTKKLPEHRYIDKVQVNADSPQEDEIALANMTPLSFYHGLYFPKQFDHYFQRGVFFDHTNATDIAQWQRDLRYLYDKLALAQPGRRLLIKNPVYTARPAMLRTLWPDAKFIHIHRNPVKVFLSMRNFYTALFAQFALQDWSHVDIDRVVLETYARMMSNLRAETKDLTKNQFVELSFDNFQSDPMAQIERIYDHLDLPDLDADRPVFEGYLESVRDYRKNSFTASDEAKEKVATHWGEFIRHWGYEDQI
ncbi:sulfotransferase family protein [Iodidimonas gelatinilytica]|uniref:Sulfotransferase family protein n=1 Tax=Iodidimonas gelatinilytica TaxID=1236966 RepID=A0A5A7MTZ8_9PROT|nr:sulfotransferase [Iodidimonas gelatinilytica]GEQ98773.1 sulfotransferase family protein [Iodidimonas gelatinilytica]